MVPNINNNFKYNHYIFDIQNVAHIFTIHTYGYIYTPNVKRNIQFQLKDILIKYDIRIIKNQVVGQCGFGFTVLIESKTIKHQLGFTQISVKSSFLQDIMVNATKL